MGKADFAQRNGDGSRGRVDETKAATDELAEVNAVAKGGDNHGIGEGFGGIGDTEIGSKERNEASDHDPLGLTTTKQLVARQPRRGVTETRGEAQNRRGRRTRPRTAPRRGQRGSLDFFICAPRESKETWTMLPATTGAASPWFTSADSKTC